MEYHGEWVISALLEDRAERFPRRRAVSVIGGGARAYGELRDEAARFAGALVELGVRPGDRVTTMLDASLEYLVAWFGIAWAGAVDVPLNTAFKGASVERVLGHSESSVLIVDARWVERLTGLHLPDLTHVIVVTGAGSEALPAACGFAVTAFSDALKASPRERVPRRESELAYILYTAGTTGPSRGVMLSNRSALWNSKATGDALGLTSDDVAYSTFPLFHVAGRSICVATSFWFGGSVVLRERFSVGAFWDDVGSTGATWSAYIGTMLHLLTKQEPQPDDGESSMRTMVGGGASRGLVEAFESRFRVRTLEAYGMTEAGAIWFGIGEAGGGPREGLAVELHDPEGNPVAPGEPGEIVVRPTVPESIFSGYWRQPEETLVAFRDLWFHTGDQGIVDVQGVLRITDRLKDSIRRRGENISSVEVEQAVLAHPGVLEAAAFPVPSEVSGEEVMIAVVLQPRAGIDARELFLFCIETLPSFAVPRYIRFMSELPMSASQRIEKFVLREQGITSDTHDRATLGIVVTRG